MLGLEKLGYPQAIRLGLDEVEKIVDPIVHRYSPSNRPVHVISLVPPVDAELTDGPFIDQEAAGAAEEGLAAMYLLEVLSGPLDGKTWPFEDEITIGRDDAVAEACIGLDRYISRQHARLQIDSGAIRLTDLQSRNGTKLDGQSVVGEVPLAVGVPFVVGRTVLRVTRS